MYKFLTFSFITFLSLNSFAQESFTTYDNTYANKTYDIQIALEENDKYSLYIDALSLDKLRSKGGIMVTHKQQPDFIAALNEAKAKYIEWVSTAKQNDVKELDKTMSMKAKVGGYFMSGKWHFQNLVSLTFDFKIYESKGEVKYLLILRTGKLQSSSNQFTNMDGFVLVFTSADEIDAFTTAISSESITEFRNKPKATDLFKD